MPVTYTNRKRQLYYLHSRPKRGGGTQFCFSQKKDDHMVEEIPEGYVIYESANAQVSLRRTDETLVTDAEIQMVRKAVVKGTERTMYEVDFKKGTITIHEAERRGHLLEEATGLMFNRARMDAYLLSSANYMPMMRFNLVDKKKRTFIAERFCFSGSIDGFIFIGGPDSLADLVKKYAKYLGKDSFYEL